MIGYAFNRCNRFWSGGPAAFWVQYRRCGVGNKAFWTSTRPGGFGGNDICTSRGRQMDCAREPGSEW